MLDSLEAIDGPEQWHLSFEVPRHFSVKTQEAIASGRLMKKSRTEVVQSVASLMLVHTRQPTAKQYNL